MGSVVVAMPAYNEADGIAEFLEELAAHLGPATRFVVVDDASTDATATVAQECADRGLPIDVHANATNLGHGPSTIKALRAALDLEPDVIVAIDGDGQFVGSDVARLVQLVLSLEVDVVEGARVQRGDPLFRRLTSAVTRLLVRMKSGEAPLDANTPLRAYHPPALSSLLSQVPADAMTPNLLISALTRTSRLHVVQEPVTSRVRRGEGVGGSTWRARYAQLPSKRFVTFCAKAGAQWMLLSRRLG